MTVKRRCNWKSDLVITETFYERTDEGSLVTAAIPPDEVDFRIIYWAERPERSYMVERTGGVYKSCSKIDENTLAVYLPLSAHSIGQGLLIRELNLIIPDNNFESKIRNIYIPKSTGCFLWGGPTDQGTDIRSEIITAAILGGIPSGGTKGQVLAKNSEEDGDVGWVDLAAVSVEYAQESGSRKDIAMSQYAVTKALNEINDVLFSQYTALTFSRTPSVIERGVNTVVTLTWNTTFNGAYEKPSALTVKKGATTLTTDTSLKTIQDTAGITETTTYSIEATIKGITKTASATVNAYYPMYFGGSASEEITSEELLALTKQSIKSSPAGQVTIPLTTGQYLWLCVPEGMSINGVGILNSSPVGLIAPVTVSVPNKGNYRCYRSDSAMIRDTNDTYIIN